VKYKVLLESDLIHNIKMVHGPDNHTETAVIYLNGRTRFEETKKGPTQTRIVKLKGC